MKCSTPPPWYTSPPPPPQYLVRTAAEVLSGLATDRFVGHLAPDTTFGEPLFVKALRPHDHDEWLVPLVSAGRTGGVIVVPIYDNGMGNAGIGTGWEGRFPHPLTPEEARAKVSTLVKDEVVSDELVWATVDPRQGGPATEFLPFYAITLRSGARWYVFQYGGVVEASVVDSVRY